MDLNEEKEALISEIDFRVAAFGNPLNTIDRVGDLCEEISARYRSVAICRLLVDADSDGFYHDLIRSAKIREYYLSRSYAENYSDFHRASTRAEAFFDALASNEFSLALRIGSLSPQEWLRGDEYEDDFWYVHFLQKYIKFDDRLHPELEEILGKFEASLRGTPCAKLEVCKALLLNDQEDFDAAFNQLLDQRASEIKSEKENFVMEEVNIIVNRHIFIEGLAQLRIAEKAGLETESEYLFCPAIARLPMKRPFPNNGYPRYGSD